LLLEQSPDFANQRDAQAFAISSFNLGVRITAFA
jgi:hypothetical protein